MAEFDRTESSYLKQVINEEIQLPEIGHVVTVTEHTEVGDTSNFEADVILRDERHQRRNVPIAVPSGGMIDVPEVDDMVLVQFLEGDDERPVITRTLYTDQNRAPLGEEGMYRRRSEELYIEMDKDGTYARITKKSNDDDSGTDATARVEIDNSTGTPNITIETEGTATVDAKGNTDITTEGDANITTNGSANITANGSVSIDADGDISLSAGGDIVIDEGGTAKSVLTEDAVFEYDDSTIEDTSEGTGTESTTTKTTTTVSNNETTKTEIE